MSFLLDPFTPPFMQAALAEVALLALGAGLVGTHVVLRGRAFFVHGVGAATFPGLVVAGPMGLAPQLAALLSGTTFAAGQAGLARARPGGEAGTAILLVTFVAAGIVLASDVFGSGEAVDGALFGSLLGLGGGELAASAGAVAVAAAASLLFWRRWVVLAFDDEHPIARAHTADAVLLITIAVAVVAAADAVGALLVGALLVLPAASARVVAGSVRSLAVAATVLAAAEGVLGLWIAYRLDVPPGPAIAALAGLAFAGTAALARLRAPGEHA